MRKVERNIFPIGLLLEGKPCLVVGGGKVSSRKVQLLLDAGACVTVISPEVSTVISELASRSEIKLHQRNFCDTDIKGFNVVYCATDNRDTNSKILSLCRKNNILCCSIDSGWIEGDFLTPAIIRQSDLTISVSTGGKACRRSRLIKESISRHISLIDSSDLILVGTSHLQLSIEQREHLYSSEEQLTHVGNMIYQLRGIQEFVIVNTCNRMELYLVGNLTEELKELLLRILKFDKLESGSYYIKEGLNAFEHGVALCSGLLSQLPGEHHITAQLKDCVAESTKRLWSGTIMKEWLDSTLHVSREVRQNTADHLTAGEIEDVAFNYAKSRLGKEQIVILIIGTGMLGKSVLQKAVSVFPHATIKWVYHSHVPQIPENYHFDISIHKLDQMQLLLSSADIFFSIVRSDQLIITLQDVPYLKDNAILFDLSLPRTIDPEIKEKSPNTEIFDLDALKKWYRIEQTDRDILLSVCKKAVNENRDFYDKLITSITGRNPQQ